MGTLNDSDRTSLPPSCPNSEGYSCQEWDEMFGMLDGTCDYFGEDLRSDPSWMCDCTGCACDEEDTCEDFYTLSLFESAIDEGVSLVFTWSADISISTGIVDGQTPSDTLCRFSSEKFACYTLKVDYADYSTVRESVSDDSGVKLWRLTDNNDNLLYKGGVPKQVTVCDECAGSILALTMEGNSNEGWDEESFISIKSCAGEVYASGLTLVGADSDVEWICVPVDVFKSGIRVVAKSRAASEVTKHFTWELYDASTSTEGSILSGSVPDDQDSCDGDNRTPSPSSAPTPKHHKPTKPPTASDVDDDDDDHHDVAPTPEPTLAAVDRVSSNSALTTAMISLLGIFCCCGLASGFAWWWRSGAPLPKSILTAQHQERLARYRNQYLWSSDDGAGSEHEHKSLSGGGEDEVSLPGRGAWSGSSRPAARRQPTASSYNPPEGSSIYVPLPGLVAREAATDDNEQLQLSV